MNTKKINDLPEIDEINNNDLLIIDRDGISSKAKASLLKGGDDKVPQESKGNPAFGDSTCIVENKDGNFSVQQSYRSLDGSVHQTKKMEISPGQFYQEALDHKEGISTQWNFNPHGIEVFTPRFALNGTELGAPAKRVYSGPMIVSEGSDFEEGQAQTWIDANLNNTTADGMVFEWGSWRRSVVQLHLNTSSSPNIKISNVNSVFVITGEEYVGNITFENISGQVNLQGSGTYNTLHFTDCNMVYFRPSGGSVNGYINLNEVSRVTLQNTQDYLIQNIQIAPHSELYLYGNNGLTVVNGLYGPGRIVIGRSNNNLTLNRFEIVGRVEDRRPGHPLETYARNLHTQKELQFYSYSNDNGDDIICYLFKDGSNFDATGRYFINAVLHNADGAGGQGLGGVANYYAGVDSPSWQMNYIMWLARFHRIGDWDSAGIHDDGGMFNLTIKQVEEEGNVPQEIVGRIGLFVQPQVQLGSIVTAQMIA